MIPRPWAMTADEIASAEEAVRGIVDAEVAQLLRPTLRPEHEPIVGAVARLPWGGDRVEVVADEALRILKDATVPGDPVDPANDDADVPWAAILARLDGAPAVGSRTARRWFAHLERLLVHDVQVSSVPMAVAAYAVARFEDGLRHDHEVWWWLQMGATQAEHDERPGLGLVVTVRAARLLSWRLS